MWGLIHTVIYIPLFLRGKNRKYNTTTVAEDRWFPSLKELFQMGNTFLFTMIAWVFFRNDNINNAFEYLIKMITNIEVPTSNRFGVIFVFLFVLFEWFMRKDERNPFYGLSRKLRYPIYLMLSLSIIEFFDRSLQSSFIYFQF